MMPWVARPLGKGLCDSSVTRQIRPPTSSATSSAPSRATATPAGRPIVSEDGRLAGALRAAAAEFVSGLGDKIKVSSAPI